MNRQSRKHATPHVRDHAYDVVVIVTAGILMAIALCMEVFDKEDQTNAAQATTSNPSLGLDAGAMPGRLYTD